MSFLRSFLSGASTVFGLAPTLPEPKAGTLMDDFCAVGSDMQRAFIELAMECPPEEPVGSIPLARDCAFLDRALAMAADAREFDFIQRQIA